MNSVIEKQFATLEQVQSLRNQMIAELTDNDLQYSLPGNNLMLGKLCCEYSEIQYRYIQSFKTFVYDDSYLCKRTELLNSVDKLKDWFKRLDTNLKAALNALSEDDIQTIFIQRDDMTYPLPVHVHLYLEELLILHGKLSVYMKALGKPVPERPVILARLQRDAQTKTFAMAQPPRWYRVVKDRMPVTRHGADIHNIRWQSISGFVQRLLPQDSRK